MKANRLALGAMLSCAIATSASAQVHQVAVEWDASQPAQKAAVDAVVAASPNRVIVASNQVLALLDRSGNVVDSVDVRVPGPTSQGVINPDFIFDHDSIAYIDPRVEYDRHSGRFWLLYFGAGTTPGKPSAIHLAISESSQPAGFERAGTVPAGEGWHIYTSKTGYPAPFDLASSGPTGISQQPMEGSPDHPAISFGPDYMYLVVNDAWTDFSGPVFTNKNAGGIVVFPRTHDGGAKSILNGERPADSDLAGIELEKLLVPDDQYFHYPVQEPFEDVAGQFFIVTAKGARFGDPTDPTQGPGFWNGVHSQIRLGGVSFNVTSGEWEYVFHDMDLPSVVNHFFNPRQPAPTAGARPATPAGDGAWIIDTIATKFDSASIARDVNGSLKIFAANYVVANNQGEGPLLPVDRHEFRWYVIDPDLANFPGASWDPQIEVVGAAPLDGVTDGETYEGAIAVSGGIAYITFTRSGTASNGWPLLIRSRLSNNYTTATTTNQFSQAGPEVPYDDGAGPTRGLGLDYADMQPDYVHCGFWGVGTIAAVPPNEPEPPLITTARAIWVTEIPIDCPANAAEMNGDGTVDAADLALFLECYAAEDQRADMDRSHTIDEIDYLIYSEEYAKR